MLSLFEHYDVEKRLGPEFTITASFPAIFVSDKDEVHCYTGILFNDERRQASLSMHPILLDGKHSTDKRVASSIKGFFRIESGCILLDNYIDDQRDESTLYKLTNRFIRYPSGASTYYGVMERETIVEDEVLTRKVFGLTYTELRNVLEGYAKILGIYNDYGQYPRLTRSVRSSNFCDLMDVWIPEQFPYITFVDNGCEFSHVSLWGFYKHIQLLMRNSISSGLSRALIAEGVLETTLQVLLDITCPSYYLVPIVTREFLYGSSTKE